VCHNCLVLRMRLSVACADSVCTHMLLLACCMCCCTTCQIAMVNMHPVDTHKPAILRYIITPVYDITVTAVAPATQPVIGALIVGDIVSVRELSTLK
jgi:hypothetical protein